MTDTIVTFVEIFNRDQIIHLPNGEQVKVNLDDLANALVAAAKEYGVRSIDLYGPALFTQRIADEAKEKNTDEYSQGIEFNIKGVFIE